MYIAAVGGVCPVGFSGAAASAALRAGVSAFCELPYWDCENAPVIGAAVPGLEERQFGARLTELLNGALGDCVSNAPDRFWEDVPLLLATSEPKRPGACPQAELVGMVENRTELRFHRKLSQVLSRGHSAGFMALGIARELLQTQSVPGCIVCGVDSFINASSIHWLDQTLRLKRDNHLDGVIPGEAAAAVYVELSQPSVPTARIAGLGYGFEKATQLSGEPLLGRGLADAARAALAEADWNFGDVDFRLSDVTGETYGFREHTLAEARLVSRVRKEAQPMWHPADCIGDTGAAAGLVQLVWLSNALRKGYAPGSRALCFTSSLTGERAVAAVCNSSD